MSAPGYPRGRPRLGWPHHGSTDATGAVSEQYPGCWNVSGRMLAAQGAACSVVAARGGAAYTPGGGSGASSAVRRRAAREVPPAVDTPPAGAYRCRNAGRAGVCGHMHVLVARWPSAHVSGPATTPRRRGGRQRVMRSG